MTRYLGLAEFFWLAEQVTGLDTTTLVKANVMVGWRGCVVTTDAWRL